MNFPPFLTFDLNEQYSQFVDRFHNIPVVALIIDTLPRATPEVTSFNKSYKTFAATISSLDNVFIEARYFFEEISIEGYTYFDFPYEQIEAVMDSIESTYQRAIDGEVGFFILD